MSGEYMKKKPLDITFHNPNSPEDSETIAKDFISRAAQEVVKKENSIFLKKFKNGYELIK